MWQSYCTEFIPNWFRASSQGYFVRNYHALPEYQRLWIKNLFLTISYIGLSDSGVLPGGELGIMKAVNITLQARKDLDEGKQCNGDIQNSWKYKIEIFVVRTLIAYEKVIFENKGPIACILCILFKSKLADQPAWPYITPLLTSIQCVLWYPMRRSGAYFQYNLTKNQHELV